MLYVGLTDKHKESATLFADVVVDQVISKLATSNAAINDSGQQKQIFSDISSTLTLKKHAF